MVERNNYVKELSKISKMTHKQITRGGSENLELEYITNVPIIDDKREMEKLYLNLMKKNTNRDLEYGTTEIGPHRDDI